MSLLTKDQVDEIIARFIRYCLDEDEWTRANHKPSKAEIENLYSDEETYSEFDMLAGDYWEQFHLSDYSRIKGELNSFLSEEDIDIQQDTTEYNVLSRQAMKAFLEALKIFISRDQVNFEAEREETEKLFKAYPVKHSEFTTQQIYESGIKPPSAHNIPLAVNTVATAAEVDQGKLLGQVIKEYIEENIKAGAWKAGSIPEYEHSLNLALKIIGDKPIRTITREHTKDYKEVLKKLPPNSTKKKEFKALHPRQAAEINSGEKLRAHLKKNE